MGILKLNDISYSGSGSAKQTPLTQAEYDALVQAGTVDPTMEYFITDGIPSSVEYYQNYSTDEQVVGTWIDGSTIYTKTWDFGADVNFQANAWRDTPIVVADYNIGFVIKFEASNALGTAWNAMGINCNNTYIQLLHNRGGGDYMGIRYLTLYYTKSSS